MTDNMNLTSISIIIRHIGYDEELKILFYIGLVKIEVEKEPPVIKCLLCVRHYSRNFMFND